MPSAGCIPATSAATFPEYCLPCGASRTGCAAFCVLRHCRGAASSTSREAPADRYREHEKSKRSRFVIARSEATWQSREGTAVRNGPPLNRHAPPICHCEEAGGRRGNLGKAPPDPYRPPLKRCWPPDLSLRGGRRPTWQSRSTRSDNRKASANSTPRKAVKI